MQCIIPEKSAGIWLGGEQNGVKSLNQDRQGHIPEPNGPDCRSLIMGQHQQEPPRITLECQGIALGGSWSSKIQRNAGSGEFREENLSEGREESTARLQLCQQRMLLECSPARGTPGAGSKSSLRPWSSSPEQPLHIPYPSPRWDNASEENFPPRACLSSPFLQGKQQECERGRGGATGAAQKGVGSELRTGQKEGRNQRENDQLS